MGEAAQHLRSQGDVPVAGIMATLKLHYGEVECTSKIYGETYNYGVKQKRDMDVTLI